MRSGSASEALAMLLCIHSPAKPPVSMAGDGNPQVLLVCSGQLGLSLLSGYHSRYFFQ